MADGPEGRRPTKPPTARRRTSRWFGWIWLVPLAAAGLAAWLAWQEWGAGRSDVSVRFDSAAGVRSGAAVLYRGVQVGRVGKVGLSEGLARVEMVLEMESVMEGRLGEGTRFWIDRPALAPGELGQLISGPSIRVAPGDPGQLDSFEGLDAPQVVEPQAAGRQFVLLADNAGGLSEGSPVRFRGLEVGRVLGVRLADGGVEIPVQIDEANAGLVRGASTFRRAGGLDIGKSGSGIEVDVPSLGAVATGSVVLDTPAAMAGPPAEPGEAFRLFASAATAESLAVGPRLAYALDFASPAGGLSEGAPVTLGGKTVGRVSSVNVHLGDGGFETPVRIVLDAAELDVAMDEIETREELREAVNALISRLVNRGLRARVAEGGLVFSGKSVELVMAEEAEPASIDLTREPPQIPTTESGGGY